MFIEHNENGLIYMASDILPFRHAFTTRFGGVSSGQYESLNLLSDKGDAPENVRENYRRVCALFGVSEDDCAVTKQVHGNTVRIVTAADRHKCLTPVPYEADGVVTAERGLPIFCFTADCVPVLLGDPVNGVVGAVHCGWRSSVADILGEALEKMASLGAKPGSLFAAIGPAIGKCCPGSAATRRGCSGDARTARPWWICAARTRGGSCSSASRRRRSTSPRSAPSAAMTNTGRTAIPRAGAAARRPLYALTAKPFRGLAVRGHSRSS